MAAQSSKAPRDVVRTLIAEASGEGPEGMRLVAETILNRARERGMTPEQVVNEAGQYAPKSYRVGSMVKTNNPMNIAAARKAWDAAQSPEDPTLGSTYFYSGGKPPTAGVPLQVMMEAGGHKFLGTPNAVKAVQQNLAKAGLYQGQIDGKLGPQTRAAMAAAHQQAGGDPLMALTSMGAIEAPAAAAITSLIESGPAPPAPPDMGMGPRMQPAPPAPTVSPATVQRTSDVPASLGQLDASPTAPAAPAPVQQQPQQAARLPQARPAQQQDRQDLTSAIPAQPAATGPGVDASGAPVPYAGDYNDRLDQMLGGAPPQAAMPPPMAATGVTTPSPAPPQQAGPAPIENYDELGSGFAPTGPLTSRPDIYPDPTVNMPPGVRLAPFSPTEYGQSLPGAPATRFPPEATMRPALMESMPGAVTTFGGAPAAPAPPPDMARDPFSNANIVETLRERAANYADFETTRAGMRTAQAAPPQPDKYTSEQQSVLNQVRVRLQLEPDRAAHWRDVAARRGIDPADLDAGPQPRPPLGDAAYGPSQVPDAPPAPAPAPRAGPAPGPASTMQPWSTPEAPQASMADLEEAHRVAQEMNERGQQAALSAVPPPAPQQATPAQLDDAHAARERIVQQGGPQAVQAFRDAQRELQSQTALAGLPARAPAPGPAAPLYGGQNVVDAAMFGLPAGGEAARATAQRLAAQGQENALSAPPDMVDPRADNAMRQAAQQQMDAAHATRERILREREGQYKQGDWREQRSQQALSDLPGPDADAARELRTQQARMTLQGPWSSVFAPPEAQQEPMFDPSWPQAQQAPQQPPQMSLTDYLSSPAGLTQKQITHLSEQDANPPPGGTRTWVRGADGQLYARGLTTSPTPPVVDPNGPATTGSIPKAPTLGPAAYGESTVLQGSQPGAVILKNQTSIRDNPLNAQTEQVFRYMSIKTGLQVHIMSGGQEHIEKQKGQGKVRTGPEGAKATGSYRHDDAVGAGDFKLFDPAENRYLSAKNPTDVPRMQEAVKFGTIGGFTGWGAETDYMGDETIHGGFGKEATWGPGGTGKPASWVDAGVAEGRTQRLQPAQVAAEIQTAAQSIGQGQREVNRALGLGGHPTLMAPDMSVNRVRQPQVATTGPTTGPATTGSIRTVGPQAQPSPVIRSAAPQPAPMTGPAGPVSAYRPASTAPTTTRASAPAPVASVASPANRFTVSAMPDDPSTRVGLTGPVSAPASRVMTGKEKDDVVAGPGAYTPSAYTPSAPGSITPRPVPTSTFTGGAYPPVAEAPVEGKFVKSVPPVTPGSTLDPTQLQATQPRAPAVAPATTNITNLPPNQAPVVAPPPAMVPVEMPSTAPSPTEGKTQETREKYARNPIEKAAQMATEGGSGFDHGKFWDVLGGYDLTQTQQAIASRTAATGHFQVNKLPSIGMPSMSNVLGGVTNAPQRAVGGIGGFFSSLFGGGSSRSTPSTTSSSSAGRSSSSSGGSSGSSRSGGGGSSNTGGSNIGSGTGGAIRNR